MRLKRLRHLRGLPSGESLVAMLTCSLLLCLALWRPTLAEEQARVNRVVPVREDLFLGLRLSTEIMPGHSWVKIGAARTERRQVGFLSLGLPPDLVLERVTLTLPDVAPEAMANGTHTAKGDATGAGMSATEPLKLKVDVPKGMRHRREFGGVRVEGLTLQWLLADKEVPFLRARRGALQAGEVPGLALQDARFAETPGGPWESLSRARLIKDSNGTCILTAFRRDGRALRLPLPVTF